MTLEEVRRTYDKIARTYNCTVEQNSSYPPHLHYLASMLSPHSQILDVGCGTGEAVGYLIGEGFRGTGVDFSESMLSVAKERFPTGTFLKLDFTREVIPGTYDAFIAYLSLVYYSPEQLLSLLQKFRENLREKGLFQLAMLSRNSCGFNPDFWGTGEPMFSIGYTEKGLVDIIESVGFAVLDLKTASNDYKGIKEETIYVTGKVAT